MNKVVPNVTFDNFVETLNRHDELVAENARLCLLLEMTLGILELWMILKGFSPETVDNDQYEKLSFSEMGLFLWYVKTKRRLSEDGLVMIK